MALVTHPSADLTEKKKTVSLQTSTPHNHILDAEGKLCRKSNGKRHFQLKIEPILSTTFTMSSSVEVYLFRNEVILLRESWLKGLGFISRPSEGNQLVSVDWGTL